MNRVHVIQELIDRKKAATYLEIGFGYGDAFLNIKAPRKTVVDPKFVILKKEYSSTSLKTSRKTYQTVIAK